THPPKRGSPVADRSASQVHTGRRKRRRVSSVLLIEGGEPALHSVQSPPLRPHRTGLLTRLITPSERGVCVNMPHTNVVEPFQTPAGQESPGSEIQVGGVPPLLVPTHRGDQATGCLPHRRMKRPPIPALPAVPIRVHWRADRSRFRQPPRPAGGQDLHVVRHDRHELAFGFLQPAGDSPRISPIDLGADMYVSAWIRQTPFVRGPVLHNDELTLGRVP